MKTKHKNCTGMMNGEYFRKLAAAVTAGYMMAESAPAMASATTIRDMSNNIVTSAGGLHNLISTVCWIGGSGLGVAGIFKLKMHVDNPGQTPMKDGLVRLGCGGGLLAFPFIQNAMQGSIANGSTAKLNASVLVMDSVASVFT
jgi:hypothetical protein